MWKNEFFSPMLVDYNWRAAHPYFLKNVFNYIESVLNKDDFNIYVIDTHIKILMFADDKAILSTTIGTLQLGLNNLTE